MTDPKHVVVAGDWHGNTEWAVGVIEQLPVLLPDESPRILVHAGDFGIWPGDDDYLHAVSEALVRVDGRLLFIDGNHEDFGRLNRHRDARPRVPVQFAERVQWLPRGKAWRWHGRWWVAAGGAVSVDRALRREGIDWWPGEEISEADHHRITEIGRADVMLCHDAPSSVPMSFGPWPRGWDLADRARSDAHQERLQAIVDELRPQHLIHGHYHRFHDFSVQNAHGDFMHVVGLDRDEALTGNYRVLDVRDMTWHPPTRRETMAVADAEIRRWGPALDGMSRWPEETR